MPLIRAHRSCVFASRWDPVSTFCNPSRPIGVASPKSKLAVEENASGGLVCSVSAIWDCEKWSVVQWRLLVGVMVRLHANVQTKRHHLLLLDGILNLPVTREGSILHHKGNPFNGRGCWKECLYALLFSNEVYPMLAASRLTCVALRAMDWSHRVLHWARSVWNQCVCNPTLALDKELYA